MNNDDILKKVYNLNNKEVLKKDDTLKDIKNSPKRWHQIVGFLISLAIINTLLYTIYSFILQPIFPYMPIITWPLMLVIFLFYHIFRLTGMFSNYKK